MSLHASIRKSLRESRPRFLSDHNRVLSSHGFSYASSSDDKHTFVSDHGLSVTLHRWPTKILDWSLHYNGNLVTGGASLKDLDDTLIGASLLSRHIHHENARTLK